MTQPEIPQETGPFDLLLSQARAGSMEALGAALKACERALRYRAKRLLTPASLRAKVNDSDLVQMTFLEAQRHFPQFQGTTQNEFLAWLFGILLHNAQDAKTFMHRAKRELAREVALDEQALATKGAPPEVRAQEEELSERLQQELRQLPDHYRRVIRLHTWEHRSFEEIGCELGCSPDAARKIHRRAIICLSRSLGCIPLEE